MNDRSKQYEAVLNQVVGYLNGLCLTVENQECRLTAKNYASSLMVISEAMSAMSEQVEALSTELERLEAQLDTAEEENVDLINSGNTQRQMIVDLKEKLQTAKAESSLETKSQETRD